MTWREIMNRVLFRLHGRVVQLSPAETPKGHVLLSYTTLPFLNPDPKILDAHSNRWECMRMAKTFLDRGYAVDVIDFENMAFIPRKTYTFFIDVGANLGRFAPMLPNTCIKVFHVTTAYWKFNNEAELRRLKDLKERRGVELPPERLLPQNASAEKADLLLLLGNDFTEGTYSHLNKPIFRIPISTTFTYPPPEGKDFEAARRSFVWIGGAGLVHKGVDLLLETFAEMPEYRLHLCGKLGDKGFEKVYHRELGASNIIVHGVLDLGGKEFRDIAAGLAALLSPSCSEGQSGAVVVGMHAGLIPVVSRESGVDTENFGVTMPATTIPALRQEVTRIAEAPAAELRERAMAAWTYAKNHHTRDIFADTFSRFVDELESRYASSRITT